MKKYLLVIFAAMFSMLSFGHSPSTSTTMLVQKENNSWVLQISASLTAFQQEIRTHFADNPYKTPEEFQQMVLEHVKNNLNINFNNGDPIILGEGVVKLGHETKVVFEVFNIPTDIQSVKIKNTAFNDIFKSQSGLFLFKEGFSKNKFVMNKDNDFSLSLETMDHSFIEVATKSEAGFSFKWYVFAFILTLGVLGTAMKLKAKKGPITSVGEYS